LRPYLPDFLNIPMLFLPLCFNKKVRKFKLIRSWGISVSIMTRLRAGRPGFYSWQNKYFYSSPPHPDRLWGSPSLLSIEYQGLFPGLKRPGREADHSPPSSAEIKNAWSYTSTVTRLYDPAFIEAMGTSSWRST
jgi:hypothetical protein